MQLGRPTFLRARFYLDQPVACVMESAKIHDSRLLFIIIILLLCIITTTT